MKNLYIIKTGSTFNKTKEKYNDFEEWIIGKLENKKLHIKIVDIQKGDILPQVLLCDGIIITGSHSMVSEEENWSLAVEKWLLEVKQKDIPTLAICYGHQLLAKALGGTSGFHENGIEIGTVDINLSENTKDDKLFNKLPKNFLAHTIHSQTVQTLPKNAIRLAYNSHDKNHAFRIGKNIWGVQFHPEFDKNSMNSYIKEVSSIKNFDKDLEEKLLKEVRETPEANSLLKRFEKIVLKS